MWKVNELALMALGMSLLSMNALIFAFDVCCCVDQKHDLMQKIDWQMKIAWRLAHPPLFMEKY